MDRIEVDWTTISREDFQAYEDVRASGVTNMLAVHVVEDLSGLDRDTIAAIMRHFADLMAKYPGVRN